jgi:hypothetical protein
MGIGARREGNDFILPAVDQFGELAHIRADRKIGAVGAAELVRIGVDMDQDLVGMFGGYQGVAIGRRLAEPRPDDRSRSAALIRSTSFGLGP